MISVKNLKLGIGVPLTFPFVYAPFFDSFVLAVATAVGHGMDVQFIRHGNGPLEELRNEITKSAKIVGCSHLIQVDADMTYPPDCFVKLAEQVTIERPVVGALTFRRYPPFTPLLMRGSINGYEQVDEWEEDKLIEVDATGTGCLCLHMSVFDKVKYPWFKFERLPDNKVIGEDIGFCADLRKVGIPIYVDPKIKTGHLSIMEISEEFYKWYRGIRQARETVRERDLERERERERDTSNKLN
jgi:hypothetical protein